MNSSSSSDKSRLSTLDAMRGLGAFAVLLFHFLVNGEMIAPKGYLAVDFFFLLSGLVIAHTYDSRLRSGMSFGNFTVLRLVRLYPLFIVGLLFGALRRFGYAALERGDGWSPAQLLQAGAFEILMLPSPLSENLFVLNGPSWSLFFEMAVSLAYAGLLFRLRTGTLVVLTALFGMLLMVTAVQHGSLEMGLKWAWFHGSVARTGFSFTLGMLIQRKLRGQYLVRPARPSWLALLPCAGLLACLLAQTDSGALFDLVIVMVVAPLLVWLGASYDPPAALQPAARWIGELSYPIYAIHYPLMFLWLFAAKRAHLPLAAQLIGFVLLTAGLAWALNRWWDVPVRRWLNARIGGARPAGVGPQTAP